MDSKAHKTEKTKLLRRYLDFVKPYRWIIVLILLLSVMQFSVPLVGPWMMKVMIDEVLIGVKGFWSIERVVLFLGIIYFSGLIFNYARNYIIARLGNRMAVDLRRKLYKHM